MTANKQNKRSTWVDTDDAPELTDVFFKKADLYEGDKLVRRGRPKSDNPKVASSLRLPSDLLTRCAASLGL